MTALRDQALAALLGVLVGFVAAYFLFESVATRQPPRRAFHGDDGTAVAAPGGNGPGAEAAPPTGAAGGGRAPFMEAVAELQQEAAAAPDDPGPRLRLANLYFNVGLWPQAEAAYGRYLELAPDDPDALTDLGVCLYQQGRFDEALERFQRAQEAVPDHWQSRFNEALVLAFGLQRWDEAEALVEELRRLQPDNPNVERLAAEIERNKAAA